MDRKFLPPKLGFSGRFDPESEGMQRWVIGHGLPNFSPLYLVRENLRPVVQKEVLGEPMRWGVKSQASEPEARCQSLNYAVVFFTLLSDPGPGVGTC